MDLIFIICTFNCINRLNKKYTPIQNLKITLHSYKTWIIYMWLLLGMTIIILNIYQIDQLIGNNPIKFFGTIQNALGYISLTVLIPTTIIVGIKMIKTLNEKLDFEKENEVKENGNLHTRHNRKLL